MRKFHDYIPFFEYSVGLDQHLHQLNPDQKIYKVPRVRL